MERDLSNTEKGLLVELFNDTTSTLQVLIMLYDVGAIGLYIHIACDEVPVATVERAHA